MSLKAGDEVDRYRIVAPLGEGGMGEVYHAFDTRLQRNVALKILSLDKNEPGPQSSPGSNPSSSRGSARMLREARAAAQLEHPNVVNVYDVGEIQEPPELRGTAFLAMELIKGKPLRTFMKDASVPIAQRIRWLVDIARALSAAHAQGLVHRDIKPENVMLRSDGVIKVLDFGIAKRQTYGQVDPTQPTEEPQIVPTLTTKGVAIGTPYYMSPEQMRGDPLDGRADQFSWGVVAYELLVGVGPWRLDGDALSLVSQVLSKPVDLPSEHNPAIPLQVAYVIVRALSKSREGRFSTMEDVIAGMAIDLGAPATSPDARPEGGSGPLALGDAKTEAIPTPRDANANGDMDASADGSANQKTLRSRPPPSADRVGAGRRPMVLAGGALLAAAAVVALLGLRARGGAAGTSSDAAGARETASARECTTNAECVAAHHGEAQRCRARDGACRALASPECVVHAEPDDLGRDDTIWIGTMLPKDDNGNNGIELARRDFAAIPHSLPVAGGSRVRRPIAVVACDDGAAPKRVLEHLLDDVGVHAVIGFGTSQEAIDLLSADLAPRGVMTVISRATSSLITTIKTPRGRPRTILRTTNNTAQMAQAVAALYAQVLEPRLTKERGRPLRVALLRDAGASGMGFSDATVSVLKIRGESVAASQSSFTEHVLSWWEPTFAERAAEAVTALAQNPPDVVLYMDTAIFAHVVIPLERKLRPGGTRPYYVSGLPFGDDDDAPLVGTDASLRKRLLAVSTPANTAVNAKFTFHYNATFADHVPPTYSPNTAYDAFYVLAYATYALGAAPVSGDALAAAVRRLVGPGRTVEVGPARILEALGTLGEGDNIDLAGAASALDFDPETGETPTDHVVLCLGVDPTGKAAAAIESGLVWDAKTGTMRGALKCP